ncbi:MAG: hypothetical protein FWC47_08740 [Oscillospiraceae bacterium]|nr:hypothetical protein [Oscillospiraceae bacterium]
MNTTAPNNRFSSKSTQMLSKVPEVTIFFWIIKVLCTTVGETFADFININLGLGLTKTSILMGVAFAIILFIQFRTKKYVPSVYWPTVVLISVFGTLVTDNMVENMGVQLTTSVILFTILLAITFIVWYLSEKTLSIHSVFTPKREAFYWLAILFTFALGTATGDFVAEQLSLGYTLTGLIVLTLVLCTFVAWKFLKFDAIFTFWIAYILTRPLGASLGDYMSQPTTLGGLGLGATITSIIFLSAILIIVVFLSITKMDRILKVKSVATEQRTGSKKFGLQVVVMICVFLVAGTFIGVYANSHNKTIAGKTDLSDELSGFISILTDMKNYVIANDFTDARAQADKLEHDWDTQEGTLRPIDTNTWIAIDGTFDKVLSDVRTTTDIEKCKTSIDASLTVLEAANKGDQSASTSNTTSSQTTSNASSMKNSQYLFFKYWLKFFNYQLILKDHTMFLNFSYSL